MGHNLNAVAVHDGAGHSDCARTTTHEVAQVGAVGLFHIDVLAAVGGDVDVFWIKLLQRVYGAEERIGARSLDGR